MLNQIEGVDKPFKFTCMIGQKLRCCEARFRGVLLSTEEKEKLEIKGRSINYKYLHQNY